MANTKITADNLDTLTTLTVDDITIDGSTISDAGDLTLDIGGNLKLDADGGEFQFEDGGTRFLEIANSSSDVIIRPTVQDKDLKFNGNDGGGAITALTLDMSDAGKAIFNAGATFGNEVTVNTDTNSSLTIKDGGANAIQILAASGDELYIGSNNAYKLRLKTDGNIVMDNGGSFGIGTSSPDEKLHVVGQAVFEGIGNTNRGNIIIGAHGSGSSKWSSLASTHYNDATGSGNGTGSAGNMLIGGFSSETTNQIYIGGGPYELNPATHIQFYTHSATTHNLGGTEKMRISPNGEITSTTQPAFLVTPSTTQSNIGTNTTTDINFGTEIFDQGSNFSGNVFTAPVTGRYQFNITLYLTGFDVSANYYAMYITCSNRNYELINTGSVSGASDPTYRGFGWSCLADMDAGDTAKVNITQSGGAAQTDIQVYSRFSGFLAC